MEDRFQMECVNFSELIVLEDAVAPFCGWFACFCHEGPCGWVWCGNN